MFKRFAAMMLLLAAGSACNRLDELPGWMDRALFAWVGGTLFSNPGQHTIKDIHLDQGNIVGRQVIVAGNVTDTSVNETYLVIDDDSARLLVSLSDAEVAAGFGAGPLVNGLAVRVLGTIETGHKGMPVIKAASIHAPSKAKSI